MFSKYQLYLGGLKMQVLELQQAISIMTEVTSIVKAAMIVGPILSIVSLYIAYVWVTRGVDWLLDL